MGSLVTLKKTNKDYFLATHIWVCRQRLDVHSIFSFVKDITILLITAFVIRQSIHFLSVMSAAQEPLGSLMRCSMVWENQIENVLRNPKGGGGKARQKLKEQRRAAFKSPSDSSYSPRERDCFSLWLLSDLQLSNSSWCGAPIDGEGVSGGRPILQTSKCSHLSIHSAIHHFPRPLISRFKWEESMAHLAGNNPHRSKAGGRSEGREFLPGLTRAFDPGLELGGWAGPSRIRALGCSDLGPTAGGIAGIHS